MSGFCNNVRRIAEDRTHRYRVIHYLDHNGAQARTAGIFSMSLLDFLKPEGSLDWHGDFSGPEPLKEQLQIRHEVLRRAAEAEEGGSFARPEEQILGQ